MKHILRTISAAVFLCASALLTGAHAELLPYPLDTIDGTVVYRYEVPRSIGLYRISVNFNVSQAEIIKWNPQLKERGLHYAETIYIPVVENNGERLLAKGESKGERLLAKGERLEAKGEGVTTKSERREARVKTKGENKGERITQNSESRIQDSEVKIQDSGFRIQDSSDSVQDSSKVVQNGSEVQDGSVVVQDSLGVRDSLIVVQDSLGVRDSLAIEKVLKIALLLPLQVDNSERLLAKGERLEAKGERFMEFYEGVLLAFNDLSKDKKYELFVYDIGKTEDEIQQLVADSAFKGIDAIIGPVYPAQVDALAPTVLEDSILTIIPFTNKVKDIETNPFLMQFNPGAKGEAKALADYLENIQDKVNCVFVDAKEADIPYGIRELRQECRNRGLSITRVSVHDIMVDSISKALKDSMENIVIFNTEKYSSLQLLLPHVMNGKAGKQITLFSQYSWQKEMIILPQIYTSVFATDVPTDLTIYEGQFSTYFKHEHTTDLPRFDLLGYDITRQLIAWLEGKEYYGLQSDMRFERVSENGGLVNTKIAVIRK